MESTHELRFESLFRPGCGLAFPCDECGRVDIDAFGERLRSSYFFARGMVGQEYATPRVVRSATTLRREAEASV